ncbi:hypothetical protein N7537_010839 [Penicillium hordei]|uniref:Uncharacterized protein n=1 Tax=Penicillium hordei TaxID=40994 RepID=A0AAD6DKP9_9EURO|nr:uncharacterized protein N7537_010839 [Penicillium hordei]KAJ5588161.1 hypothetical protein N7537_010839 [Penicillium hordei]
MSDSAVLYPAETNSGTVTSYVPLTTTWTPSPECFTKYRLDGPSLMAFDPAYGLDVETGVLCGPPAMTTWWEQGLLGDHGSYATRISIGPMSCPDNWSTLASSTKDSSSVLEMCCPSGFYLGDAVPGSVAGNCLSKVSSGMTLTYGSTANDDSSSWSMATTTMTSSSTVGAIGIVGWNIKYPSTATATSTTSATTTTPSTSVTSQNSNSSSPSSLDTGAKIGIGVGIGVGAIGVIALLTALYLFRRRKQRTAAEPDQSLSHYYSQPPAMSVHQARYQPQYPAELDAPKLLPVQPAELSSRN